MTTESEAKRLANGALAAAAGCPAEVSVRFTDASLTRFANNEIHQNVAERSAAVSVRVGVGRRWGTASTNDLSDGGVQKAVAQASEIAQALPNSDRYLPLVAPATTPSVGGYDIDTAEYGPMQRAAEVRTITGKAADAGLTAAGAFRTSAHGTAVANSEGLFVYHAGTTADLMAVVMDDDASGHAGQLSTRVGDIDAEAVADEAAAKAIAGRAPRSLPPGDYEVVLEEFAVSDMLDFLGYVGFGGLAVEEGRSFMSGRLGEAVMGPNVTIWDDPLDPAGIPRPFDAEGAPARRTDLVRDGAAASPVHDRFTAAKAGTETTGHALPAHYSMGPIPRNMFLAPGGASRDGLVASVRRGLLITRFWYTRVVHPLTVHMTGITRDGVFLIEDGEIAGPVRDLRFTESYLEALTRVDAIAAETKLVREFFSVNRVPALKIASWRFTGR